MSGQLYSNKANSAAGEPRMASCRVLVGLSVYEDAELTVNHGKLFVEFKADDLEDIAIPVDIILDAAHDRETLGLDASVCVRTMLSEITAEIDALRMSSEDSKDYVVAGVYEHVVSVLRLRFGDET